MCDFFIHILLNFVSDGPLDSKIALVIHEDITWTYAYRKVSNIRRTKYQNLNASRLIL